MLLRRWRGRGHVHRAAGGFRSGTRGSPGADVVTGVVFWRRLAIGQYSQGSMGRPSGRNMPVATGPVREARRKPVVIAPEYAAGLWAGDDRTDRLRPCPSTSRHGLCVVDRATTFQPEVFLPACHWPGDTDAAQLASTSRFPGRITSEGVTHISDGNLYHLAVDER